MALHPFDILSLNDGSSLIFTPCPGTKDVALAEAVAQLSQAGAQGLITLMPDSEMARHGASVLPEVCGELGLHWYHLPVDDDGAPGECFQQAWSKEKASILSMLDQQQTIAIHCKGGSGRTGLMAAIIMLERGYGLAQATAEVQALRPKALKLEAHTNFLASTVP